MSEQASLHLELRTQTLRAGAQGYANWETSITRKVVNAREAAIVICDMWDNHWSRGAAERVNAMAPRMNEVLCAARARGVHILHAPSDTLDFYAGTPARERILAAPPVEPPQPLVHVDPPLPIDDSDGGSDTGEAPWYKAWTRQHAAIEIDHSRDAVSADGHEVYSYVRQQGIKLLLLMGVQYEHVHFAPLVRHQANGALGHGRGAGARPDRRAIQPRDEPLRQPRRGHAPGDRVHREVLVPERGECAVDSIRAITQSKKRHKEPLRKLCALCFFVFFLIRSVGMSWKTLQDGNPGLASFGAARLHGKVAYLATLAQRRRTARAPHDPNHR